MVLETPPIKRYGVQVLATHFQCSGQLEVMGPVLNYINDPTRESLPLYDAHIAPLAPESPLKALSRPQAVLLKAQVVLLYFTGSEARASIRPFPHRERLVAYTPVVVCRGYFHMSAEANVEDFLDVTPGDLLPMSEVQIFPLVEPPAPFPSQAELLLINPDHIQIHHPA